MKIHELFFEFSHEGRIEVFKSLWKSAKKHKEIEKDIDLPGSEISRHLKRLKSKKLVFKTSEGKYCISNIGKIFYQIMNIFEVSIKYKDFLNTHDITPIPLHLLMQLGQFSTAEISTKTIQNIELWADLVKNSENFIYAISNQLQNSLLPIVERNILDQDMEIRALVDKSLLKSYNIPKEWAEMFENPVQFYKKLNVYHNVRILKDIELSLVVSDKGAILFLSKDDDIDYSNCLIDNHPSFIRWCQDLFEYYWKKGKLLKPFIRKQK